MADWFSQNLFLSFETTCKISPLAVTVTACRGCGRVEELTAGQQSSIELERTPTHCYPLHGLKQIKYGAKLGRT